MSGFNASTAALEPLDFDFTEFKHSDGSSCEGKGTVPEPSQDLLDEVFEDLRTLMASAGLEVFEDGDTSAEVVKALNDAPDNVMKAISGGMLETVAKLTQGEPTREQLEALPARPRGAFYGWLLGQFGDPQRSKAATAP
jgi:hypothetical protein